MLRIYFSKIFLVAWFLSQERPVYFLFFSINDHCVSSLSPTPQNARWWGLIDFETMGANNFILKNFDNFSPTGYEEFFM